MNILSFLWLNFAFLFNPTQKFFNGNFWESFVEKFGRFNEETVIDLACGTGELRKYISPQRYLGVDFNSSYINYAKQHINSKNTNFIIGNILDFQTNEKFDVIFLVGSSHHLSDDQLMKTIKIIKKNHPRKFILCDGYPQGIFKDFLWWLDDVLGGGKYFRDEKKILTLIKKDFKIVSSGCLSAKCFFYKYPYVIAR